MESRATQDRSDWMLNPVIFQRIDTRFGPRTMDMFASRTTTQCQAYYSWWPDPYALATYAFLQDWPGFGGLQPWSLIARVLAQVQIQEVQVVLVAPVWKTQPWHPTLLHMLIDLPCLIPQEQEVMISRDSNALAPQLGVWNISGRDIQISSFWRKLHCTSLILQSWRPKTNKSYDSLFYRWHSWCHRQGEDPFSGPITGVANFMADLHVYKEGLQYNSLNMYCSAISSVDEKIQCRWVECWTPSSETRLTKGVFHNRPPLPKYSSTWNVQSVVDYIISMGDNEQISLKHLTQKTTML